MSDFLRLDEAQLARIRAVLHHHAPIATLLTPAELHYVASRWNWDRGVAGLQEIVERPDCSLATAVLVFWRGLPDEVVGFHPSRAEAEDADGAGELWDLQTELVRKVAAGGFVAHGIGYDPEDDNGTNWLEDWPEDAEVELPRALCEAVPGERVDPRLGS